MSSLSVVVICRNEETHIGQCLRSVEDAAAAFGEAEIVVVDSASTDRTVEIALSYGARVLSLRPTWDKSPSAGRFVGFYHTTGELIMFVDGDTTIDPKWFCAAVPYFAQSDVAGAMGYLKDFDSQMQELPYTGRRSTQVITSPWLRGIAMYRRSAMQEAGTFNPYLLVEEEAELAFRLRKRGWKLLQIPHEMGSHLGGAQGGDILLSEMYRRRFSEVGSTLRYSLHSGGAARFVFERNRPTVIFVAAIATVLVGAVLAVLGYHLVAEITLAIVLAAAAAIAIKKRSIMGPLLYIGHHGLTLSGLVTGFLTAKVKNPRDYPLDIIEVGQRRH